MLIKRHLWLFFRDRATVFFSMLSVIIVILLYVLFLGEQMVLGFSQSAPEADLEQIRLVVSGIVLSGTVALASVSSCLNGSARLVMDREREADDFFSSPISRGKLMFSYVVSSGIIGLTMSGVALVTTLVYLGVGVTPQLVIAWILGVISANSMMFLLACSVKSRQAFSSVGSLVGTLIGFLAGVYLPIGQLPASVGRVIRLFPTSHVASMFRQVLAGGAMEDLFLGAPVGAMEEMSEFFGVGFSVGAFRVDFWVSAVFLLVTSAVCYGISWVLLRNATRDGC